MTWSLLRFPFLFVKDRASDWRPQFSDDERLAVRQFNSELHFHQNLDFEKFAFKGVVKDVGDFVLSPGAEPTLACFIPPTKGQPAFIQLRQCNRDVTMISQKTSFNADRCTMTWNSKGSHVLVTATADVDKSDKSYYGVSHLYVLSAQGDNFQVPLDKEGPLHAVQWNPTGREFCVCYGFMPSKICVFNLRGDVVWNLGAGHRNEVHYNRFGTLLLTCGFGNISKGHMQFWSVEEKREVISIEVPNTTLFEWAPDGQHFLTATTAPRLRIDNVYRIWHYSGRLIREVPFDRQELWQVTWKPVPNDAYCKFKVAELTAEEKAKSGLLIKPKGDNSQLSAMPAGSINQKGAYVPPHMRNKNSKHWRN
ncbi:Translation initiation factor 2A [Aphelenchoides avenae]|nr:Translation initiation factor 2A [Aphelenchus avenae]